MARSRFSQKQINNFFCHNYSTRQKNQIRSFVFGRIYGAPICLWFYLTFKNNQRLMRFFIWCGGAFIIKRPNFSTYQISNLANQVLFDLGFRPMNPLAMANYQIELTLLSLALSYHTSFEWRFLRRPPLGPLSSKHTWTFYDWFHSLAMQNQANQLSNSHIHLTASVKRTVYNRFYIAK